MCSFYFQKIGEKNPSVKDVTVQCPERIREMLSGFNQNEAWRVSQVIQVKMEWVVYGYTFVFNSVAQKSLLFMCCLKSPSLSPSI